MAMQQDIITAMEILYFYGVSTVEYDKYIQAENDKKASEAVLQTAAP